MAPVLTLSQPIQRGVKTIWSLQQDAADQLHEALEAAHSVSRDDKLAEQIAPKVSGVPRREVGEVVRTLSILLGIAVDASVPLDEFCVDVYDAMEVGEDHRIKLSESEQLRFRTRLKSLLAIRSVNVAGRARRVFTEHGHYFCYARIMTDIRPVFGESVKDGPLGAAIVYTLKLGYHDAEETREFFVALDGNGLDTLADLIERAKRKAATLRSTIIEKSGTEYLDM